MFSAEGANRKELPALLEEISGALHLGGRGSEYSASLG